jgi:hypothetical protein
MIADLDSPKTPEVFLKLLFAMMAAVTSIFGYLWGRIDHLDAQFNQNNVQVEQRLTRIETKLDQIGRVVVARRPR